MKKDEMFGHEFVGSLSDREVKVFNNIFNTLGDDLACFSGEDGMNNYTDHDEFVAIIMEELVRFHTDSEDGQYFIGGTGKFKGIPVVVFNVGHSLTTGIDEVFCNLKDAEKLHDLGGRKVHYFGEE